MSETPETIETRFNFADTFKGSELVVPLQVARNQVALLTAKLAEKYSMKTQTHSAVIDLTSTRLYCDTCRSAQHVSNRNDQDVCCDTCHTPVATMHGPAFGVMASVHSDLAKNAAATQIKLEQERDGLKDRLAEAEQKISVLRSNEALGDTEFSGVAAERDKLALKLAAARRDSERLRKAIIDRCGSYPQIAQASTTGQIDVIWITSDAAMQPLPPAPTK